MANGNTSPSRLGQINETGGSFANDNALFLKVFSGEILTAFEETNVMKDLHMIRTISNGKSAQFPVSGIATAKYHTAGENIVDAANSYLTTFKHNERIINIDDVLVSSTFIANIDELKNHYDVRSIYARELGKALAKRFDIATLKTLYAASSAGATAPQAAGNVIANADLTTAAGVVDALYAMASALDNKDVSSDGRFAVLAPETYYKLLTADNVAINKDTTSGTADAAKGRVMEVAGIQLFKSTHIKDIAVADAAQDQDDDNANNNPFGDSNGYNHAMADLTAGADATLEYGILGGTKDAIGTVKLLDLATESEYQIERQGTLFVAKYAMGHGILRPECAVQILPAANAA